MGTPLHIEGRFHPKTIKEVCGTKAQRAREGITDSLGLCSKNNGFNKQRSDLRFVLNITLTCNITRVGVREPGR